MEKEKFLSSVYLIIKNESNEILLQRRQGTKLWPHFLALPAGHIDEGENAIEAAIREAKEELNINITEKNIIDTFVVNRKNKSLPPYYDVYFEITNIKDPIIINEPDKCSELVWANADNLPNDMITFEKKALENNNKGIKFSTIYIDNEERTVKDYFNILEPNYPEWLNDYINTIELQKQKYISITCGTIYSDLFESDFLFSSLDHSIAVALIIWHFTHDKKQTLAGLFHDIATPVFKHCIDFLNGDYMKQESTEELTTDIIKNSKEIMKLLKRDNIKLEEVNNYQIYPIADNDTPKLSADRLEYSLSNAFFTYKLCSFEDVKKIYNDIVINKNEENIDELSFTTSNIALEFVKYTSRLSIIYREDRTRYSMQFLADIIKKLNEENIITINDLYNKKESEIINIIENSKYKEIFEIWKKARKVETSKEKPLDVYYINHGSKIRYIDPLVKENRISHINEIAKKMIADNLKYDMNNYVYIKSIKKI